MAEGANPPASSPTGPTSRPARRSIRVPILAVVLVVAACAMAFTALRTASQAWHEATYTFTVFLLLFAVLASRFRRGRERAFWFGLAVFGWAYFLLGYRPWMNAFGEVTDDGEGSPYNPLLLTSRLIAYLLPHIRKPTNEYAAIDEITRIMLGIAHLLMTLVVGIVGGLLAISLWRRPRARWSTRAVSILVGLALVASVAISFASDGGEGRRLAWWARKQAAMGEPSPLSGDRGAPLYRLVWVPTFHHPVCVRLEGAADGARLRVKILDGLGGYEPGQIAIDRTIRLTDAQWDRFERLLDETGFRESAPWSRPLGPDDAIMDGDEIIFEGLEAGRYQVRREQLPDPAPVRLCGYMLELTGIIGLEAVWEEYHSGPSEGDPM